ncbi:MAG TPA: hypothetical protein VMD75_14140 [Candidatus Binataceae bacterium]|nr:hypothetical protein [Candidatus Binataceae bacterium]
MTATASRGIPNWLEAIDGGAPILLIAPHGGLAGPESHALAVPRVNDLHTAELTRELAKRLNAAALINAGMDRNQVDCNRLSQVVAHAPWLLTMIAERLERMVVEKGRALVLAIHGWNLIEPRLDIGVGLTLREGVLAPSREAHVSVSDRFLSHTLRALITRLERAGIVSTFGMRYPAGGAQNLVQAFTARHQRSEVAALRRLASLGARGVIEAVQLELSIALRFPGVLRDATLASVAEIMARHGETAAASSYPMNAAHRTRATPAARRHQPARHSARLGFEFYDPQSRIGATASFDLGAGGGGGRVMILMPSGAVVLFTGERGGGYEPGHLKVGPLRLESGGGRPQLEFAGAALVTPDAETYINIERALSLSSLEMETGLSIEFTPAQPFELEAIRAAVEADGARGLIANFGGFSGRLRIGAADFSLCGVARIGAAFTALDNVGFEARRMLWACSAGAPECETVAAAEFFGAGEWRPACAPAACRIITIDPPRTIQASVMDSSGVELAAAGEIVSCVPLVRADAHGRRFRTLIGFAEFEIGDRRGFGMFEYSRRAGDAGSNADPGHEAS